MSNCIPNESFGDEDVIYQEWADIEKAKQQEKEDNWRNEDEEL